MKAFSDTTEFNRSVRITLQSPLFRAHNARYIEVWVVFRDVLDAVAEGRILPSLRRMNSTQYVMSYIY
jgi:hypothetical protein